MIKNIREQIRNMTNEGLELAIRCVELTNEGMQLYVMIPRNFRKGTVVVEGTKRPFDLDKLRMIRETLRGTWEKQHTTRFFSKIESVRHSSAISLTMRFYFGECLNPSARDKVKKIKGIRGKVLTPELCDGAETSLMRGLQLKESA